MTKFLDRTIEPPGGGRAASGDSFYHVSFRSGSRATERLGSSIKRRYAAASEAKSQTARTDISVVRPARKLATRRQCVDDSAAVFGAA